MPEVYESADQRQPGNVKAWQTLDDKLATYFHYVMLRLLKHLTRFDFSLQLPIPLRSICCGADGHPGYI